jgi:membrane protein DedA with SNARE-associated domain
VENWILVLAASPFVYLGMYLFATIDGFFPPIPSESLAIALVRYRSRAASRTWR